MPRILSDVELSSGTYNLSGRQEDVVHGVSNLDNLDYVNNQEKLKSVLL